MFQARRLSSIVDCRLFDFLLFAPPDFSRRALPIVALQTKRTTTPTMQMSGTGGKMRVVTIKLGYVSLYRLCRFRHFCRAFRILAVRWNFGIFSANFFDVLYYYICIFRSFCSTAVKRFLLINYKQLPSGRVLSAFCSAMT